MNEAELSRIYAAVRAARRNLDGTAELFSQRNTPSVLKALQEAEAILEPHVGLPAENQAEPPAPLRQAAQAIMDAANSQPGRMRDRPDYVASISCDLLCRLQEALREGKA